MKTELYEKAVVWEKRPEYENIIFAILLLSLSGLNASCYTSLQSSNYFYSTMFAINFLFFLSFGGVLLVDKNTWGKGRKVIFKKIRE